MGASVCFGTAGVVGDSTASAEAVAALVDHGRKREKSEWGRWGKGC